MQSSHNSDSDSFEQSRSEELSGVDMLDRLGKQDWLHMQARCQAEACTTLG